jgi:hypothetical protein
MKSQANSSLNPAHESDGSMGHFHHIVVHLQIALSKTLKCNFQGIPLSKNSLNNFLQSNLISALSDNLPSTKQDMPNFT